MKLSLYLPVKPLAVNQNFGANPDLYKKYGLPGHNGIDFRTSHGQPVYASHDGMAYYEIDENFGHGIVLLSDKEYDLLDGSYSFIKTIYWHLVDSTKEPTLKSRIEGYALGVPVKVGDLIGYADNTGNSSGDHLHFGLKTVAQNETNGAWYNTNQNNGYKGAIDPQPYLNGIFAQDIKHSVAKFTVHLSFGEQGEDVHRLQTFLMSLGYNIPSGATGFYGYETTAAVKNFQKDNVIFWTDGRDVGPITRKALNTYL